MSHELPLLTTSAVDTSAETNTTTVNPNPIQSVVSTVNPHCTLLIPSWISSDHTYPKMPISSDCDYISAEKTVRQKQMKKTKRKAKILRSMRDMFEHPLVYHIAIDQPTPEISQVVSIVIIISHPHKLTLMDDLIN